MRPDEHKQKKSAQYQKKHNIKKNSASQKVGAGDQKKDGSKSRTKPADGVGAASGFRGRAHDETTPQKSLPQSDSDASDSENEAPTQKKTFQRRKIVSNWERYEVAPEADNTDILKRGEDFTQLLSSAGGALSQLRLKDEAEWEGGGTASVPDFLAVDCDELASSLACLPLHQTLGLDKNIFTEEQINEMNSAAATNRELYKPPQKRAIKGEKSVSHTILRNLEDDLTEDHEMPKLSDCKTNSDFTLENLKNQPKTEQKADSEKPSERPNKEVADKSKATKSETASASFDEEITDDKKEEQNDLGTEDKTKAVQEEEEELDFLLSMDKPQTDDAKQITAKKNKGKVTECFLGGKTITDTTTTVTQSPRVNKAGETKSTQSQELDDWLDSILDD